MLVASFVTEISVADMGGIDDIVADPVATEIFAKRASEDIGALDECTRTLHAKIFKDNRTTSRFSRLFADLGDYQVRLYDDRTTRAHQVVRNLTSSALGRTVCSLTSKQPWSSPKNFRFRRCRRSNLDQNLPRITNPVSDLTGDQYLL